MALTKSKIDESQEVINDTVYLDPFCHYQRDRKFTKCDDHILVQYGVEVDKDTGDTKVIKTGEVDLTEVIQSSKDTCGMEAALKMIRTGQVGEDYFMDKGGNGLDCTAFGTDVISALEKANAASGIANDANALGIKNGMSEEEITAIVNKAVQDALNIKNAQATEKNTEVK